MPCAYYLVTFTVPAELRPLARSHQRILYHILLGQAASSLQRLADDPHWVGGTLGILAVLHTWSRDLAYHPHVHLLVTAGGLAEDGQAWRKPAHRRFLVPGYALSRIFRAKVSDALDAAGLLAEADPRGFEKPWTVHLQHAGDGRHAIDYLSRYVHRVALTNDRLEEFSGERVTLRYVSSRTHEAPQLTLPVQAFIARFLQHVLPKGFPKIRAMASSAPPPPTAANAPATCSISIPRAPDLPAPLSISRHGPPSHAPVRPAQRGASCVASARIALWSFSRRRSSARGRHRQLHSKRSLAPLARHARPLTALCHLPKPSPLRLPTHSRDRKPNAGS